MLATSTATSTWAVRRPTARYFGQWLMERGLVRPDTLDEAIARLDFGRRPLGEVAVARGALSSEQRAAVRRMQWNEGGRFGEVAMRMGVLSEEQLDQLLEEQRAHTVRIGEALVAMGVLDTPTVEREAAAFLANESERGDGRAPEAIRAAFERAVEVFASLLGTHPKLDWDADPSGVSTDVSAHIELQGPTDYRFGVCVDRSFARQIAARMLDMDVSEIDDELMWDCAFEAVNVLGTRLKEVLPDGASAAASLPRRGLPAVREHAVVVLHPGGRAAFGFFAGE
ncbi:MAG: hypothetical protein AB7S26_30245 [Sandaracinaceae bacterium]